MKRAPLILLAALMFALGAAPPARALRASCDKSPYDVDLAVVHANGVSSSLSGAKDNLERLRNMVDRRLGLPPYTIAYGLAYNQERSWVESIAKLLKEWNADGAQELRALLEDGELSAEQREQLREVALEVQLRPFEDDSSLKQHLLMYREHLRSGHKVLVIAHSEGNMYANAAYRKLFENPAPAPGQRSFGIIGIAPPVTEMADAAHSPCGELGCYTRLLADLIIDAIPDAAPINVFSPPRPSDPLGHALVRSYLADPDARVQILGQVAKYVAALGPLEPTLNDSTVTAYLEWDTDADLDLHVYEGGGSHVYSSFPDGGGHLDADVRSGLDGPEHYYAECAELLRGDMRFAVGYYDGVGPVTARLQVKVHNVTRTFTRTLTTPLEVQSFTQPVPFATLIVTNRRLDARYSEDNTLVDDFTIDLGAAP